MKKREMKRAIERLERKVDAIQTMMENILALRGEQEQPIPSAWGADYQDGFSEDTFTPDYEQVIHLEQNADGTWRDCEE